MASNVKQFSLALKNFGEQVVPEKAAQVQRAVALEALSGVVLMSPVLTGRFRGNWQTSTDTPASGTLETTDPSGGETINRGSAEIAKLTRPGMLWLSNNLDYAESLENGHSQQAPGGMVNVTVQRLLAMFGR